MVGRDSFWIPPHILLYCAFVMSIATGLYAWWNIKGLAWWRIVLFLSLALIAAPFDEFWRRVFDKENINNVLISWSLPHLILLGSLFLTIFYLIPILRKDENEQARWLFGGLALAGLVDIGFILTIPFFPTGPFQVFGFWGAGIVAFVYCIGILVANRHISGFASSTIMAILLTLLSIFAIEGSNAVLALSPMPYNQVPTWLILFALLIPAIVNDLAGERFSSLLRGLVAGVLWGGILFGFSSIFFASEFKYSFQKGLQATVSSGVGGMLAAIMLIIFQTEKVIYRYSV